MNNKSFQELNLKNGFLFPVALEDPVTCRLVLECILDEYISELIVKMEYSGQYNSDLKCIRLDVFAKDVTEVSYNLEMQNKNEYNLPLRSRFYQAEIDMMNSKPGDEYSNLKPLFIIFICDFDPFGKNLYRYTFSMQCEERDLSLNDGVKRIFLSTKGKNVAEVPGILIDFLGYLGNSTDTYVEQNPNEKLKEIHERIKELKRSRDVEARYMHYLFVDKVIEQKEKALREAENAAREAENTAREAENAAREAENAAREAKNTAREAENAAREAEDAAREAEDAAREAENAAREAENAIREMVLELAEGLGEIPESVCECIKKEEDINVLKLIHKAAVNSDSVEQFEKQISDLL